MTKITLILLAYLVVTQLSSCTMVVGQLFFRAGAKNTDSSLPALEEKSTLSTTAVILASTTNPAQVADNSQFKIACYRDHINAAPYNSIYTDGSHETSTSRTVQIDAGRMRVDMGESIVIEATMGSVFLNVDDGDITTTTDFDSLQVSMSVQMFQGCSSAETCLTGTGNYENAEPVVRTQRTKNGVRALDPNPDAAVLLRAHKTKRAENLENANEYAEFVLDAGGNTGRFFFPELQSDEYFLVVNFEIIGLSKSSAVSVGLGPHLIVAERFRAQGQVCVNEAELVSAQKFVIPPAAPATDDKVSNP